MTTSLRLYARLTAASAFFLLIAGGMVTSMSAGLSVPDWPLAFGMVFPPMVGPVFYEHGHRLTAAAVSLLTFGLAFWVHRTEERRWVRHLALAAAAGILGQALLGGLTVILKLPAVVSISHACLGQAIFCLLLLLAQATTELPRANVPAQVWKWAAASAGAVYLQLFLGALLRHTGHGLPLHMAWAVGVTLSVVAAAAVGFKASSAQPALTGPAIALSLLLPLQLALGFLAWAIRHTSLVDWSFGVSAAMATAHLAVGALILGSCVILSARAYQSR